MFVSFSARVRSLERKVPKLRQGAVPNIVQHEKMPVYMSTTEPELRSTEAATSTASLRRENEQIEFSIEEHFRAECVTSLLELEEKLKPRSTLFTFGSKRSEIR